MMINEKNLSSEAMEIIRQAQELTVQKLPDLSKGNASATLYQSDVYWRGPILANHGTRERERELLYYYRNDYNTIFKSAIAGLVKRVQSTPWEVRADDRIAEYFQTLLNQGDFGRGWDSLLSKLILDYSRYDAGAYIEIIGAGDVTEELVGPVQGLAILDSLRCWPTGDPNYPVVYYDVFGAMHVLHFTRVHRFYDMPESHVMSYGENYGECALSRCIATVRREILMNRYVDLSLDDQPPPGLMLVKNISKQLFRKAEQEHEQRQSTDFGDKWGRIIQLFGLDTDRTPEIEFVTYTSPPEKFDFRLYKELNVKEIALGIGLDIQDIWELTGQGLGTATQSEILHQKSKGRALGRIFKGLERLFNQLLPEEAEFEFHYQDSEEDEQTANVANLWSTITITLDGKLTEDEQRQLLANQVEAIRDVITDQSGEVVRLPGDDPKAPEQLQPVTAPDTGGQQVPEDATPREDTEKQIQTTRTAFKVQFMQLVQLVQEGRLSSAAVRPALRLELVERGTDAYLDGLREGGIETPTIDAEARKEINAWRIRQRPHLSRFVKEIFAREFGLEEINRRADMWVNMAINDIYYIGLENANRDQRYMWVMNPLKEHCRTCLKLNGQIHRMKEYRKRNLLPQSHALVCRGFNCGCSLQKTDQPARGRIRAVPYLRKHFAPHYELCWN